MDKLFRKFILSGGFDIYGDTAVSYRMQTETGEQYAALPQIPFEEKSREEKR